MSVREMLDAQLGRPPMHDEIAREMRISQDRYDQLSRISQLGREVHFSAMDPRKGSDSRGPLRRTCLGCRRPPSDRPLRQTDPQPAYRLRHPRPEPRERLVLVLYYFEDLTMAEIGVVLSLSESRVSQIHKDVISRRRTRFKDKHVEELLV
jgi:RNA polymerase sigma factor for flagellar operon FliA